MAVAYQYISETASSISTNVSARVKSLPFGVKIAAGTIGALVAIGGITYATSPSLRRQTKVMRQFIPGFMKYKKNESKVKAGYYKTQKEEDESWEALHRHHAPIALKLILELEGIYYKYGQVYGSRVDFVPRIWYDTLKVLVGKVPHKPWSIMSEKLSKDFGRPLSEIFAHIDEIPIGAASVAQVHTGYLCDSKDGPLVRGTKVAIKSSYPNAERITEGDLKTLRLITKWATPEQSEFIDEFADQVMLEFDFRREARMASRIRSCLAKDFSDFIIPKPVDHLVTKGTMVMDYIEGIHLPEAMIIMSTEQIRHIITRITQCLGQGIFIDGIFQSDPHPGNFLITNTTVGSSTTGGSNGSGDGTNASISIGENQPKICMLDFGQCKELDGRYRLEIAKFIVLYNRDDRTDIDIINYMRSVGFKTKYDKPETYAFYAKFACDSVYIPNPMQKWMEHMNADPFDKHPGDWVMFTRVAMLLRGLVSICLPLDHSYSIAKIWLPYAQRAIAEMTGVTAD